MKPTLRFLSDLCERRIELHNPADEPDIAFRYIDIGSVNNRTRRIEWPKLVKGSEASVRARQVVHTGDVLVSTVRPNLNNVALVSHEQEGAICSTGFCVLRSGPELVSGYLFAFVQSRRFVGSLVQLVQGALYPAVTDRQIFSQQILWVNVEKQQILATQFMAQFEALTAARLAAEKQIEEIELLGEKLLSQFFEA